MVVEESEFRAALRFDMAAARIAEISRPLMMCGMWETTNVGKIVSVRVNPDGWRKQPIEHE